MFSGGSKENIGKKGLKYWHYTIKEVERALRKGFNIKYSSFTMLKKWRRNLDKDG